MSIAKTHCSDENPISSFEKNPTWNLSSFEKKPKGSNMIPLLQELALKAAISDNPNSKLSENPKRKLDDLKNSCWNGFVNSSCYSVLSEMGISVVTTDSIKGIANSESNDSSRAIESSEMSTESIEPFLIAYNKIKELSLKNPDLDLDWNRPLASIPVQIKRHLAFINFKKELINLLSENGSEIENEFQILLNQKTPLGQETIKNWIQTAMILLDHWQSEHLTEEDQMPIAHRLFFLASAANYWEGLRELIVHEKIDPNIHNNLGKTALHHAALKGHLEATRELIAARANLHSQDDKGLTALHCAALSLEENLEVVSELLAAGADPNCTDIENSTALHEAAGNGHLEIVRKLLAAGADPTIQDLKGQDASHYAMEENYRQIIKELLTARANFVQDDPLTGEEN